jgi:hypothetical protein
MIDEGSELCDICTQPNVLGAPLHGRFTCLCMREFRTMALMADRNFKRPSRIGISNARPVQGCPQPCLSVTSLRLRPSLGAAWLAWAIWATSRLRRRAFGRCRATKPASRTARMAPTPAFTAA